MSERAWLKALELKDAIDELDCNFWSLYLNLDIPSSVTEGANFRYMEKSIDSAREKVGALCAMLAEYRADGEPFEIEKDDD